MTQQPLTPHRAIAARVQELRKGRGWSAQRLADELRKVGIPWDRSVVANFETGRRASIGVDEMLALAYVLEVAPVHLVVPPDTDASVEYQVTPEGVPEDPVFVRAWIRGQRTIGLVSPRRYFSEVPSVEWVPPAPVEPGNNGVERAPTATDLPILRAFVADRVAAGLSAERAAEMEAAIDRLAAQLGEVDGER